MESVHGIWNGDVDLADGKVQELYQMYRDRQTSCNELGPKEPRSLQNIKTQIQNKRIEVKHDMEFLSPGTIPTLVCCITTLCNPQTCIITACTGLADAQQTYQDHLEMSTTQDTLKKLAWDVDDYRNLHERGLDILQRLTLVSNTLDASSLPPDTTINAIPDVNIPRILSTLRPVLLAFEKDVFKKKRKPAKDVLVLQISESTRRHKPYAIPVQCIPHSGLRDAQVRNFSDELKKEMMKAGLKPQGRIMINYVISIIIVLPILCAVSFRTCH